MTRPPPPPPPHGPWPPPLPVRATEPIELTALQELDDGAPPSLGTTELDESDLDDGEAPIRDRIVVLGRRQSGKTIFLASIYAKLWKASEGLSAKALTGEAHKQLITAHRQLSQGQWPPSTLGTTQIDLEIEYHGRKRLLVALDFAGELFSKVFVDEQNDWPGAKQLVNHIDHAAAVMLLVDPSVVAGLDHQAATEDDFGLVQAVQRIRNWPGGDKVPIVLVLTKTDQHQALLDRAGGPLEFVRKHYRALLRVLKEVPIIQISAVQVERGPDGKMRPKKDFVPVGVQNPLRYCLREIEKTEKRAEAETAENQQRLTWAQLAADRQARRKRAQRNLNLKLAVITTVGSALVFLILFFNV